MHKPLNPHIVRGKLLHILNAMKQDPTPFVMTPGVDFSRNRSMSFDDVFLATMMLESHKIDRELYDFFSPLKRHVPSRSAFSQQRAKINSLAFPYILSSFNQYCPFFKKMKGFRVLAIDGSDLNVPADIRDCTTFIPYNSNNGGYHQLHLNALFDLLEKRYLDIRIQPRADLNETAAACDLVDTVPLQDKCLFVCDRGYANFNLMAHIIESGHCFLIRGRNIGSANSPYRFLDIPDSPEFDIDVRFTLTRSSKKIFREDPASFKIVRKHTRFDFIDPDDKRSLYPLSYRLIKITLDNGTPEYLLTNLPRDSFRLSDMQSLYHLRWEVETSFLFLKYGISLNYFHSIKTERLYQEIYAKIILFNFISLIIASITVPDRNTKYEYKISFSDAIYLCRHFLMGVRTWPYVLTGLLRHLTPVRPGRSYRRNVSSQKLRSLQHRS